MFAHVNVPVYIRVIRIVNCKVPQGGMQFLILVDFILYIHIYLVLKIMVVFYQKDSFWFRMYCYINARYLH